MHKIYAFLIISLCIVIILIVWAFLYLDTHRHHIYYYNITVDGKDRATAKLDKYVTEDRIIYSSFTDTPFHSYSKIHKRKLVLDSRDFRVCDYNKKKLGDRTSMDIYLKRMDGNARFLTIGHSNFAYLDRLPVDKDFVIFEEDALISYTNLISKYNFKKKELETFQTLTHSFAFLPPSRQTVTLKLVGEDNLNLDGKKLEALKFDLRAADNKKITVWINKWNHTILKVENPRMGFAAVRTGAPKILFAKQYGLGESDYIKKNISFKSGETALAGTLVLPKKEGPHPAAILVPGPGPQDRDGLGLFVNLARFLASNGIACISYDKRGVGESQGNFSRFTKDETIEDLEAALDFLIQQKSIDKTRIAVLGHSEGGFYASKIASENQNVSACIIMAGMVVPNIYDNELENTDYFNKTSPEWDKEYLDDISRSASQTMKIVQGGRDWALLLGKRVYLKKARLDLENKPLEVIRKVKAPTLILQGKKDALIPPEHAKLLEGALKEGGNQNHQLVYFNGLGHFFGNIVRDGVYRTHLTTDKKVMAAILKWLNDTLSASKEEVLPEEIPTKIEGNEAQPS